MSLGLSENSAYDYNLFLVGGDEAEGKTYCQDYTLSIPRGWG